MAAGDSVKHGNFTFTETSIEGVLVVDVTAYGDERGYFVETYKRPDFVAGGIDCEFVQDNQSSSVKGVLRGLHFQIEHPQSKLVRVVSGEVFDVAVDLRSDSPTYGKWEGAVLSAENRHRVAHLGGYGTRAEREGQGASGAQGSRLAYENQESCPVQRRRQRLCPSPHRWLCRT